MECWRTGAVGTAGKDIKGYNIAGCSELLSIVAATLLQDWSAALGSSMTLVVLWLYCSCNMSASGVAVVWGNNIPVMGEGAILQVCMVFMVDSLWPFGAYKAWQQTRHPCWWAKDCLYLAAVQVLIRYELCFLLWNTFAVFQSCYGTSYAEMHCPVKSSASVCLCRKCCFNGMSVQEICRQRDLYLYWCAVLPQRQDGVDLHKIEKTYKYQTKNT